MEKRELSIALREMARVQKAPLCDEWYGEWADDTDVDSLLEKYVRGFDFAVKNDYPPLDFIRRHFSSDDLHRHNIYLDEDAVISEAHSGFYVFLGKCKCSIVVDGFKAVTVYVRHESEVDVSAINGAKVFVTYYDHSGGECSSDKWSKARRYDRGV